MTDQESALPSPAGMGAPRVFVSYTWEDDEYRTWVKRLSIRLIEDGVNARLDAWHCRDKTIPEFMNSEARAADKVLILCSPKYREKVHATEDGERMTGSGWEAMLVGSSLFAGTAKREKFLVALTRGEWMKAAPDFLAGAPYFDLSAAEFPELEYLELLRALLGKQEAAPPVGKPPPSLEPTALTPLRGRPEAPPALLHLRDAVLADGIVPELDERSLQSILRHSPRSLDEYRLARIAEWSQPRYALDKRFTRLTLLLDQGPDAQGARWQPQARTFDDLRELLTQASEPALVILGPPGCGKSTLLRRLELDLALDVLRAPADDAVLTWFLPLNRYRAQRPGEAPPPPGAWLAQEWAGRYPRLPAFPELLRSERAVLLLDAVNEIPHADEADYHNRIGLWRDFLAEVVHTAPGIRVIFSCRSLDYSASLSVPESPVPHVRIEQLGDEQVEAFLALYNPEHGAALWRQLRGTPQLDLFRSPFYLKLLATQAATDGLARGRAALFTGFVRQALAREIEKDNLLFRPTALLDRRDQERIVRREWRDAYELPTRAPSLFPQLSTLAHAMQERRTPGDDSRVRTDYDEALALLGGGARAEDLLNGAVALQVLEVQWDEIFYVHQLLQEYFAARALAAAPQTELARTPWRAAEMTPGLDELLASLADSDPLPAAPPTGWEETCVLTAEMQRAPDAFVSALEQANLPLAGRCAAQPDVAVSAALRRRLQQSLIARSRDPEADLRARIAAARALGELGDPRFERRIGPHGEYLLPPLVPIEAGRYPNGSDEGLYEDEAPAHEVTLDTFAMGQFPVTNAEWRCFLDAGGYDDYRWWETDAARRWQRGEGTAEGPKQGWRQFRQSLRDDPERIQSSHREGRITSKQAEDWEKIRTMSDVDFESLLEDWYPPGRQTRPAQWDDPAFNHPAQPVVGICWHEAHAYCAWLSHQTGQSYRLPAEVEWEAATRGRDGRSYPWPGEFDPARCNTFESHIRSTTPVGVFPGGDTREGLSDMAGNVWEWTTSLYRPYRYDPSDGREDPGNADDRRVVRGGSWDDDRVNARCAYRGNDHPDNRVINVGFRLVCVSPLR